MSGPPNGKSRQKPFMAELQLKRGRAGSLAGEGGIPVSALADTRPDHGAAAPVAVDQTAVLDAIAALSGKVDRFIATDHTEIEKIQIEISEIAGRIKATKAEMAALRHPLANEDRFQQASEELTAVVSATEAATNAIMQHAEEMDEIVQELRAQLPEGYQSSRVNDMNELIVRIYEACNFQDLTGQRITKVVRALSFIEERVEAMMGVWNRREFELMPLPPGLAKKDGDLELHGPNEPQPEKGMISQSEIDALFD